MLSDKVMLVSGTGPGLGREIAVRGAAAGADVVLAARTEKVLRSVAAEVEALGRRALVVPADILDPDACRGLTDRALEAFGRVDVFVSNAFVPPAMGDLATMDVDAVRASLETDALAALRLVQLLTPTLTDHAGSVVMVSSAVVHHSRPGFGAYKASKSALRSLAGSLATELGPRGVRVNTVVPNYIWTEGLKGWFAVQAAERGVAVEDVYAETAAPFDLRRLPEPGDVANAVLWLASDLARAVTGQSLNVDAGEFHS
ncbi:SDR family oxidoreductase [Streptomyces evansiae]|uniref:SDR family oxidoreductase n=1 Tax=Streptomyces evansiae TaxID=3075535 RepID=UPI002886B98A|nr:SDR family oxidoreductase [Streptomyces sp. DSM 41859]MDT0420019.1 SDR family oxidoreductase [Streptomyces sp. DSM 41859]